jgi:CRP-like cAMP-binding protein
VKLFQLSDPSFILSVARCLQPKICLARDWILVAHQIANEMFFIKKGYLEVIATDKKTVIAYLGEGSYFGEIGLLLTGKRSCSVRSLTACVLFSVGKEELIKILDNFPL